MSELQNNDNMGGIIMCPKCGNCDGCDECPCHRSRAQRIAKRREAWMWR